MASKYYHRPVPQNVLPPTLSSMEYGPVIKSFEVFALKKSQALVVRSEVLPVDICYLPSMQHAFKEVVISVVEMSYHKQFGHFKFHYASVCTNVTLIISVVI